MNSNKPLSQENRLLIFDFVRVIAIVMMLQGHAISSLTIPNQISGGLWEVWAFLRKLTAPTFLFVSGAVHVFANRRDINGIVPTKTLIKRLRMSVLLFFTAYILVFPAKRLIDLLYVKHDSWTYFFQPNILQLFAVLMILLVILLKFTRTTSQFGRISFLFALFIIIISPFTEKINWFSFLPEFIAPYFSTARGAYFPIFPWVAYFFFGSAFGALISRLKSDDRIYAIKRIGFIFGIILLIPGIYLSFHFNEEVLMRLSLVLIIISFFSYFVDLFKNSITWLQKFAKYSLFIYTLQILLLYGSSWYPSIGRLYEYSLSWQVSLSAAIILIISCFSAVYYLDKMFVNYPNSKKRFKQILYLIISILMIFGLFEF